MKIVGKRNVIYTSKRTNQLVEGIELHCTGARNNVEGLAVESIFISVNNADYNEVKAVPLGTEIRCSYNRWGNVDSVQVCK